MTMAQLMALVEAELEPRRRQEEGSSADLALFGQGRFAGG